MIYLPVYLRDKEIFHLAHSQNAFDSPGWVRQKLGARRSRG